MFFDGSPLEHPIATCTPTKNASVKQRVSIAFFVLRHFSREVGVTVFRRLVCSPIGVLFALFLAALALPAQPGQRSAVAHPTERSAAPQPVAQPAVPGTSSSTAS